MNETSSNSQIAPMIDFKRVKDLIPSNGRLTLTCFQKGDHIVVVSFRAPNGKEKDKQLVPLRLEATPEELNAIWETTVKGLGEKQDEYIATLPSPSIKSRVEDRKKELDKAIKKNGAKTAPASSGSAKKDTKPAQAPLAAIPDLFSVPNTEQVKMPSDEKPWINGNISEESPNDMPEQGAEAEDEEEFGTEQEQDVAPAGTTHDTQEGK